MCYGGALKTGYGAGGALVDFAVSNFQVRFRHYAYWISSMMTPLVPLGWVVFAARSRRPMRIRLMLLSWFAAFFLFYCFYGPYETWWYTRYLLPGLPALLIASAMLAEDILARVRERAASDPARAARAIRLGAAAVLLAAIAVCAVELRFGRRREVLQMGRGQAIFPDSIRWASRRVPERTVVLAMEFSGAMRAYGWGTFVRWDYIDADRFPALRRVFESRGYGIYALLLPHEVHEAAPRVPGVWTYLGANGEASLWRLESAGAASPGPGERPDRVYR